MQSVLSALGGLLVLRLWGAWWLDLAIDHDLANLLMEGIRVFAWNTLVVLWVEFGIGSTMSNLITPKTPFFLNVLLVFLETEVDCSN